MSERILAGYISQDELAAQLNKRRRTLQEWDRRHIGPPITRVGGTPYYEVNAVREWLQRCGAAQSKALTIT
jgi:hypothetical protein